jgi:hypothetical protein
MNLNNISEVERVFQEFYDPMLSNQRKLQLGLSINSNYCNAFLKYIIEQIIAHIKNQPNAWVNARYYITNSNSQYLLFAAVTIYEEMIKNGKWDSIPIEDQHDLRNLLLEFLLAKNRVCFMSDRMLCAHSGVQLHNSFSYLTIYIDSTLICVQQSC